MKTARIAFAILLMVSALGCRTRPLGNLQPIDVRPGLTKEQVEIAILMAVSGRYRPPAVDPRHRLTQQEVDDVLGFRARERSDPGRRGRDEIGWRLEHRGESFLEVGYYSQKHFMVVDLQYDEHRIVPRIVDSQNLRQSKTRIHKAAIVWTRQLMVHIDEAMTRVASLR